MKPLNFMPRGGPERPRTRCPEWPSEHRLTEVHSQQMAFKRDESLNSRRAHNSR